MLELHNGNGQLVDSNDNWESGQRHTIIDSDRAAGTRGPRKPAAGNYSAIVRGTDNSRGVALVEVYVVEWLERLSAFARSMFPTSSGKTELFRNFDCRFR